MTAIIATDDLLAFGAQDKIMESGKVKIALVGFNNIPLAQYKNDPFGIGGYKSRRIGYYGTKLLIDKVEGKNREEGFM